MPKTSAELRRLRLQLGLTQLELAAQAGIGSRTVQFAESGRRVSRQTIQSLATAMNVAPAMIVLDEGTDKRDAFLNLPWSVGRHLESRSLPVQGSLCKSEDEVCEVVAQMRHDFRLQIERSGDDNDKALFVELNNKLDRAYIRYERHYIELWKRLPESILVDREGGELAGVSVVIPMKAESFNAFCRGEKSFLDIDGNDVQPQSQHLLLDSTTEFPGRTRRPWYKLTQSLSFIAFSQMAMLSISPRGDDFEMASFSASAVNLKRLTAIGFSTVEKQMAEFGYQLCRFGGDSKEEATQQYANGSTLTHFAHLAKQLGSKSLKQRLVKEMLHRFKQRQPIVGAMDRAG